MNKLFSVISNVFTTKSSINDGIEISEADTRCSLDIPLLSTLPNDELDRLNNLLPWAAYVVDEKGRAFGKAHSKNKRNTPQKIPDYRANILDEKVGLHGKTVLEVGCFEGIHTVGLAKKGALVTAFDSRIENIVKTMVRCSAFNVRANVCYWNLENEKPDYIQEYDIVHHIGVLYHLLNPIQHLKEISACAKSTLLLDTHVALEEELDTDTFKGFEYRYYNFIEGGRESPFAGMKESAKWIYLEDLIKYLKELGFSDVDILEQREERNGHRVLICASK